MILSQATFDRVKELAGPDCQKVVYTGCTNKGVWFSCSSACHKRGERLCINQDFQIVERKPYWMAACYEGRSSHIREVVLRRLREPVAVGACPWTDVGGEG